MERKHIALAAAAALACAAVLALAAWAVGSQAGEAPAAAPAAGRAGEEGPTLEEARAAMGDAERSLASELSETVWENAVDDGQWATFSESALTTVSGADRDTRGYALSGASTRTLSNQEGSVERTTATITLADGSEHGISLDRDPETGEASTLTCEALPGSSVYVASAERRELSVSTTCDGVKGLLGGSDDEMRAAVAEYCEANLPKAVEATASDSATVDFSARTVSVPWTVTGGGATALTAVADLETGAVAVKAA